MKVFTLLCVVRNAYCVMRTTQYARRNTQYVLRIAVFLFLAFFLFPSISLATRDSAAFSTPRSLADEVRFWKTVFGTYDRQQFILYDERYLSIIYRVLDFSNIEALKDLTPDQKNKIIQENVQDAREKIKISLGRLASGVPTELLTEDEKYYQKLFNMAFPASDPVLSACRQTGGAGEQRVTPLSPLVGSEAGQASDERRATPPSPPVGREGGQANDRYESAMERIRVQAGQRSNLSRAIAKSYQYMGDIEAVFESYGLPKELTAIVFIESMFNPKALSQVGASGIWQFMPEVGKEYVSMNSFWDNRNDPMVASDGAARLLRDLYNKTRDWALAVNSYHSGLGRLQNAVKKLGTRDISVIIHRFDDPAYGFYSRNYYPEFLAVVELYRNRGDYIGTVESGTIEKYDIVKTADFANLPAVASRLAIDMAALQKLNPALSTEVIRGSLPLPPNYPLKVPKGTGYTLAIAIGYPPNR